MQAGLYNAAGRMLEKAMEVENSLKEKRPLNLAKLYILQADVHHFVNFN